MADRLSAEPTVPRADLLPTARARISGGNHDFSVPPSLLMRHTANELLWEIDHYNDAYLYYLLETGFRELFNTIKRLVCESTI